MSHFAIVTIFFVSLACAACGSAAEVEPLPHDPAAPRGEVLDLTVDTPADGNWKVRAPAMTLWMSTLLEPTWVVDRTLWRAELRVSKTLDEVQAYLRDGTRLDARRISPRRVELRLTDGQLVRALAGEPVLFDLHARRGEHPVYHAMARFKPAFAAFEGAPQIFVLRWINPVRVGAELRFRGRAVTAEGWQLDGVYNDDDSEPTLRGDSARRWRFDWEPARLLLAASPTEDPVYLSATDGAEGRVQKKGSITMRLVSIGLSLDPHGVAWPPVDCRPEVRACLEGLEAGEVDTEDCGWSNEVDACLRPAPAPPSNAAMVRDFVVALRHRLADYYEVHGQGLAYSGGRTLAEAQALVRAERVREVDDLEPGVWSRWDLDRVDVVYHPDTSLPASPGVWYGVFEAGRLIEIERVN